MHQCISDEMAAILEVTVKLTDQETIREMFQATDTNHDGRISFVEFLNMMKE